MSKTSRCLECGSPLEIKRENIKYDASGLSGVTLADIEVRRCPACGEVEFIIPAIDQLHKTLAMLIAQKKERLVPQEVRFLRKYLGFSGADLAEHLGVAGETVSRWENGATPMSVTAERFLRYLALTRAPLSHYALDGLKGMAIEKARPTKLGLRIDDGGWRPAGHKAA